MTTIGTCDIRFSLQNRHAGQCLTDELTRLGVSNHAVTISGRATISDKEIDREEFVRARPGAIRARLRAFLAEHELPRDHDLVILDIEPTGFAPRQLGDFEGREQRELIAAYRRRIVVAREVLARTGRRDVRLGLYQVIVPDGRGRVTDEFRRQMAGYRAAGCQGMYDELDFICPVLYQRFGRGDAEPGTLRRWSAASTRQGIEESLGLTRRNGSRIPLVPVLSFWVFNGNSVNERDAVTPDSVARQLQAVQRSAGITAVLFWSGWQTKEEMRNARKPVEPIDLGDFLAAVDSLPGPGCHDTEPVPVASGSGHHGRD
jgi:hypothetical protein